METAGSLDRLGKRSNRIERSVVTVKAAVMVYDDVRKGWRDSVTSSPGVSRVQIYHHQLNNTYRIVARNVKDHEVTLNVYLTGRIQYNETTPSFHQWRDRQKIYGLNFTKIDAAKTFAGVVLNIIDSLSGRNVTAGNNTNSALAVQPISKQTLVETPSSDERPSSTTVELKQQTPDATEQPSTDQTDKADIQTDVSRTSTNELSAEAVDQSDTTEQELTTAERVEPCGSDSTDTLPSDVSKPVETSEKVVENDVTTPAAADAVREDVLQARDAPVGENSSESNVSVELKNRPAPKPVNEKPVAVKPVEHSKSVPALSSTPSSVKFRPVRKADLETLKREFADVMHRELQLMTTEIIQALQLAADETGQLE